MIIKPKKLDSKKREIVYMYKQKHSKKFKQIKDSFEASNKVTAKDLLITITL